MNNSKLQASISLSATVLGALGAALFCDSDGSVLPGCVANLCVWIAALFAALFVCAFISGKQFDADGKYLAAPIVFFASAFIWKGDSFINFWNAALMIVCLCLFAARCRGPWRLASAGLTEYFRLALLAKFFAVFWPAFRIGTAPDHVQAATTGNRQTGRSIVLPLVKGLLVSVVPLTVFGALFASADPIFRLFLSQLFNWNFQSVAEHCLWFGIYAWLAVGVLFVAIDKEPVPDQLNTDPLDKVSDNRLAVFGAREIIVVLTLIDILFATFVIVQFEFLFGGRRFVDSIPNMSYPEYARSGFFELAWAAGLTLPILLVSHWGARLESAGNRRKVGLLTAMLTFFIFVIVASAFKRMWLYEAICGLTEKRLLVSVFIGAISLVFVWFGLTVWRGNPQKFSVGVLAITIAVIGGLDLVNTDALVVRVDAARSIGLAGFSGDYLFGLGPEAVPELVKNIDRAPRAAQGSLAYDLITYWNGPETTDWRNWNRAHALARECVAANIKKLRSLSVAPPMDSE